MDYEKLLKRAKEKLPEVQEIAERFDIPNVKGHIQGNKTIISNFNEVADTLRRPARHIMKYLSKELAAKAALKQDQFLIFNTKLPAARINEKVHDYTHEYVICKTCGKPDTSIEKIGQAIFQKCQACGSQRPLKRI